MPIHDWTRVSAGTFHAFHVAWVGLIQAALNGGRLPPGYYAMAEQIVGPFGPDVLTLQSPDPEDVGPAPEQQGGVAVATAPTVLTTPVIAPIVAEVYLDEYVDRRRTIVIRHSSEDRVIALIELVSPGNKSSAHALRSFVEKAAAAMQRGLHLLIVDLHPPGPRDPNGIHGAIWEEIGAPPYTHPAAQPLTVAAYSAGGQRKAYIYPIAVGDALPDGPLFLTVEGHVLVPLEATYQEAYRSMPYRWRRVLEATPG